jgi:hypothetical protein
MNKKYLSVILFGALMLGTTGTFTSCKDYDDDINNLQEQITANADAIKKLQDLVGDGKFVTGVTSDGNTITFTFSDNSTVPVTIETEQAQKVEVKGDELYIDDQPTGIKVAKEAEIETGLVKAENGTWWVLGEDGKYTDTEIPVSGVTAVKNDKDQWVLTIYSQDGSEPKTIVLPTAASLITEIEVLGVVDPNSNDENTANKVTDGVVKYNAKVLGDLDDAQKAWNKEEGVKTLAKGQALSTLYSKNNQLLIRLAPATVDASEMSFTLVNTQLGEAPLTLGTPAAYKGLLTRSAESNGLWMVPVSAKEGLTYKDLNAYKAEFEVNGNGILFAFQEKEGFTSDWNLSFKYDGTVNLSTQVYKVNSSDVTGKTSTTKYSNTDVQTDTKVAANVDAGDVTITFTDANALYDAHLHFDEATIERWGIKYTEGTSFTITTQPDDVTAANFQVQVHYVDMTGTVKSEWIILHVNKSYSDVTEYPNKNVEIAADNTKNTFDATLDAMFTNLGSNLNKWKADVENSTITYQVYDKDSKTWNTATNMTLALDKAEENQATKFTWKLNDNKVAMQLGVQYRVVIEFTDKDGEVLSKLIQPITFSIPALSNFLVKEQVVFGGTSNGKAYMNIEDQKAPYTNDGISRYAFHHAFNKFDNVFANNSTITFAIDPTQKIGNTAVTTYAKLINTTTKDVAIELVDNAKAYHTPIQIVISEAKYLGIYKYSDEELAANAFTLDVMSPIEQGNVVAANAAGVSVVATADGTALVKESDFKATTYANVAYKVFMDAGFDTDGVATEYSSEYIDNVAFASANANVFKVVDENGNVTTEGFPATKDDKGVNEGYIIVKPANAGYEATENVNITVTDIWGYSKKAAVSVTVKPSTAE